MRTVKILRWSLTEFLLFAALSNSFLWALGKTVKSFLIYSCPRDFCRYYDLFYAMLCWKWIVEVNFCCSGFEKGFSCSKFILLLNGIKVSYSAGCSSFYSRVSLLIPFSPEKLIILLSFVCIRSSAFVIWAKDLCTRKIQLLFFVLFSKRFLSFVYSPAGVHRSDIVCMGISDLTKQKGTSFFIFWKRLHVSLLSCQINYEREERLLSGGA